MRYKTPMSQDLDAFQAALDADLQHIYRDGLPERIEADYAPALTELAEAISGEQHSGERDHYSLQVENLLREAIGGLSTSRERREGLEKLFGISGDRLLGLEARRANAAQSLGYKDTETLRRGEVNKRPLHEVVLEQILQQVLALASKRDFVYTARYRTPELPSKPEAPEAKPLQEQEISEAGSNPVAPTDNEPASSTDAPRDAHSRRGLWQRLGRRRRIAAVIGVMLLLCVAVLVVIGTPASHRSSLGNWGPSRLTYDYERYNGNNDCDDPANPAAYYGRCGASTDYPVFNSFINTPSYGDERAFFDGYRTERSRGHASDPITNVTRGNKVVILRVYVDNMAKVDEKSPALTTAYNARVRILLPTSTGTNLLAYAYISADRTVTVYDSVDLTSSQPFAIEYIPGSAVLLRNNQSYRLSDEIIGSEGALIGDKIMNGVLSPETDFSGSLVELQVRAVPQAG